MTIKMTKEAKLAIETLSPLNPNFDGNTDWKVATPVYVSSDGTIYKVYRNGKLHKASLIENVYGYFDIFVEDDDRRRHLVKAHRVIYSALNGRKLRRGEIIHHKNGIKKDNSLLNLEKTVNSINVSYYFSNATGENDDAIKSTKLKYPLAKMRGAEFWVKVEEYGLEVSSKGRLKAIDKRKKGDGFTHPTSNIKYPRNLIVGCIKNGKHSSISLGKLYVKAFYIEPEGSYKVLVRDTQSSLLSPLNYYISQKKRNY